MANKTVYPFGQGGSLPAGYPIADDLKTNSAQEALSAKQGVVLNQRIIGAVGEVEKCNLYEYTQANYSIDSGTGKWAAANGTSDKRKCVLVPLDDVTDVTVAADGGTAHIAFLKTNTMTDGSTPDFSDEISGLKFVNDGDTKEWAVPADANYLYALTAVAAGTDVRSRYDIDFTIFDARIDNLENGLSVQTIYPKFMYIGYDGTNGKIWGTYQGTGLYSTPRFIAVVGKQIGVTVGKNLDHIGIFEYGADFSFLKRTNIASIVADTKVDFTLSSNTAYIKILLCAASDYSEDSKSTVKVEGQFARDWDVFNLRSTDSGYQRVMVCVRVTDPTCCDEETDTVQDDSQILKDYGVICLPTQYSNIGRPTRLIIYCHGAAVNYSTSVTRFNSVDLEPEYWLKEGYAVLDVEGNPFNNTDEHICIPQAMECYLAAYKWAIEYYNLCRDGIFLGGRSMGGQNTFNLMRRECPIPVIAACPNSAAPDLSFGYNDKDRKAFCALHMGFVLPEGFTWKNGECDSAEKAVLADNWDKFIKCCAELTACEDLPDKDTILANMYGLDRRAMLGALHMRAKCPVKLFGCNQDESCPPPATTSLYYKMLMNAGQIAECRLYNSYKDYTGTGTSAHHYDTQDPALRANITTSYGEALTDIPIVYIEMLAFWRRYEQGL